LQSRDADPHAAHRALDVERAGAGADCDFFAGLARNRALAAGVVDGDLAHRRAGRDLHAGLLVQAEPDTAHLASHPAVARVESAVGVDAAGLRRDVDRRPEVVYRAAAGLHLGGDRAMHAIHAE